MSSCEDISTNMALKEAMHFLVVQDSYSEGDDLSLLGNDDDEDEDNFLHMQSQGRTGFPRYPGASDKNSEASTCDDDGSGPESSDTDMDSDKSRPKYKHVPHREKPLHVVQRRNARERRRVQTVNGAFMRLRRHIPYENRHKRLSKVKTLRIAIDYIRHLQTMVADHDSLLGPGSANMSQHENMLRTVMGVASGQHCHLSGIDTLAEMALGPNSTHLKSTEMSVPFSNVAHLQQALQAAHYDSSPVNMDYLNCPLPQSIH